MGARMAPAQEGCDDKDRRTRFHEDFAAVQPVDGNVVERGINEEGMPEERDGTEVDGEVEGLPEVAAEANASVRGDDDDGENVESDGAQRGFEGLLRRVDRIDDVQKSIPRGLHKKQDERMGDGEEQREVPGPVVEAKIVEAAVRPGADRTVAKDHERAQEHVERHGAGSDEAKIGAEIQEGHREIVQQRWGFGRRIIFVKTELGSI